MTVSAIARIARVVECQRQAIRDPVLRLIKAQADIFNDLPPPGDFGFHLDRKFLG